MAIPIVEKFIHEIIFTALISGAGALFMWPLNAVKKEWKSAVEKIDGLQSELTVQRTNHLSHIEASNDAQVQLLKETVKVLNDMHLDQRLLLGRLDK